jgi:hypothetical protein
VCLVSLFFFYLSDSWMTDSHGIRYGIKKVHPRTGHEGPEGE